MVVLKHASLGKLIPMLTVICLLALPAWYGLRYWQWQQSLQPVPQATVDQAAEKPREQSKPDREKLLGLFGKAEQGVPVAAPVKESTLSLKLLASYVAAEGGRSAAVIAGNGKKDKLHYQGDKILPGVELVAVQARRVLIKRNGVLESVSLDEGQKASAQARMPEPAMASNPSPVPPARAEPISREKLTERLNKLKALASGEK